MKRKFVLFVLILCFVLASCTTIPSKDKIITIEMSEEAKAYLGKLQERGEKAYMQEEYFPYILESVAGRGEQVLPECEVNNKLDCKEFEGCNVYTITPDDDYENIVLYIHGGAWVFEISSEHVTFCDELATRLNAKVYIPLYPMAPEYDSLDTYEMIEALYKKLIREGKKVYVMGDSAGGNLALGLLYTVKDEGLKAPSKVVLIAPCSDMTFNNDKINEIDIIDPTLAPYGCIKCAELWAGEENLADPKNSAVYADVKGYPDTMIIQGTNDILSCDNFILYENMKTAGVDVTLVIGEGLWHVFPIYSIPEREESLDLITEFCSK